MRAQQYEILTGDCCAAMSLIIDPDSIDSIVTDPPYELGFMGKSWDRSGVAFDPETWRAAYACLKPGGHLLAFGGSRTYHRMVCAVEDAGFEIRDQIMWVYGSGFPKSHNGEWGGTALKPAHEPIVVARKPLIGTVAANWREHGTGALNIDGCRVDGGARPLREKQFGQTDTEGTKTFGRGLGPPSRAVGDTTLGRWPANLIHDGSAEVLAAFPQTGTSSGGGRKNGDKFGGGYAPPGEDAIGYGDTGSAARFFYCAKASKSDRGTGNTHPTVKPTALMRYLCRLVTPPGGLVLDPFMGSGSTGKAAVLEGFRFIGIELSDDYVRIAESRIIDALASMVGAAA